MRVLTASFEKMRLTCDFTVSGEISRVRGIRLLEKLVGEALADHCKDIVLTYCERIPDAVVGLCGTATGIAVIPP